MDKDKLLAELVNWLKSREDIADVGRIDDEFAVGFNTQDGEEYFIELQDA